MIGCSCHFVQKGLLLMKRIISLLMILLVFGACAIPIIAEAAAESGAAAVRELDVNFNFDLATVLIIVICSVLTLLILTAFVILAKRNHHS